MATEDLVQPSRQSLAASLVAVFTASGTLVCCALPAAMVALGAGAALAGLVTAVPQLVWLSEHKLAVNAVAAVMLVVAGLLLRRARRAPCPLDSRVGRACMRLRRVSAGLYAVAVGAFIVGVGFAWLAPLVA
jgi:hypothetical protein